MARGVFQITTVSGKSNLGRLMRKFAVCLLLCPLSVLKAQSTFATIIGSVKDPSGTMVPNAIVELVNIGTNQKRTTLTDATGNYGFPNVDVGSYTLAVNAVGFSKLDFTSFSLGARETKRLDAELQVAAQIQTVNVESAGLSVVQTDTSNVAETKTGRELVDLPVAITTRGTGSTSPMSTLPTQPGVQTDSNGGISVLGASPTMLSMSIDGISSMGPRSAGPINEMFPSFNSIEEIKISQIVNPAEFGGVADITTISKSGTNAYHGGLFENLQNNFMNARNTFSSTVPALKMNDFGGFLGGPVTVPKLYSGRDKTFFFLSFEGLQLARQTVNIESVPTSAMRHGDLSAYLCSAANPVTRCGNISGYPGNIIPASRITPLSSAALNALYPLPNYGAAGGVSNNYLALFPQPIKSNQGDLRVDQKITSNQQVYARLTYKNRRVLDAPTGSPILGAFSKPEIDYGMTIAYNYVISPRLINELRTGANGNRYATSFGISASAISDQLGLTQYLPQAPPDGNAVPDFRITGFQSTGGGSSSQSKNRVWQVLDSLTWTRGAHTLKFGGDYRYLSGLYTSVFATRRLGRYQFNNSVMRSILGNTAATPFASFLLGLPDVTSISTVIQPDTQSYASHYAFFAQDDWKLSSRLTLNFGLRWEYHPMFLDHLNNLANFLTDYSAIQNGQPVRGAVVIPNETTLPIVNKDFVASIAPTPLLTAAQAGIPESLRYSQKTDFAPRIGFAWRMFGDDKTVLRGGYGRFIEALLGSAILNAWAVESSYVGLFTNTIVNGKVQNTFPYPFPSSLAQPGIQTFYLSTQLHYKDPYVNQWDLTLERDLGKGMSLRLSYDGSHGTNLGITRNADQLPVNTAGYSALKSSVPFPAWAYISEQASVAESNYQAATIAVTKRFSQGIQFQGSYIFARNLSDNGGYAPAVTGTSATYAGEGGGTISDPSHPGLDYGNVNFTRRHRFLATFLYELPFGSGKPFFNAANGFVSRVIGGWQLAGVLLFQTGPFMTVTASGADPSGTGFPSLAGDNRADVVSGANPTAGQSLIQWVNPAAFAIPADNIGRFGTSGVGYVQGPGTQAVSMSLFKAIAIRESARLQIGASAANLFNHPNYDAPANLNLGTSGFAQITNLQTAEGAGPRALQLTARFNF